MLSFMREQEPEDSSAQKPTAVGGIGTDSTGEAQEQEYLTVSARDKNARKSTVLLAALFVIGLLCLWFMIKKTSPQTAKAAVTDQGETQIEAAISQLTGIKSEMFNRMDEIVKRFYEFSDVPQVNVDELAKNPFKYEIFLGSPKETSDIEERDSNINLEMIRKQRLRQQAKDMQLLSIIQSKEGNCCMIDDKILYKGDSIKGFSVSQISGNFVKLESEGVEIILKLSE